MNILLAFLKYYCQYFDHEIWSQKPPVTFWGIYTVVVVFIASFQKHTFKVNFLVYCTSEILFQVITGSWWLTYLKS